MADRMSDLLGSLMQSGLKSSTASRIEHSLSERGIGGEGGLLEQIFGKDKIREITGAEGSRPGGASTADSGSRTATTPRAGGSLRAGSPDEPGEMTAGTVPAEAGGALESLGKMATAVLSKVSQDKTLASGGLGALAGAILGGGSGSMKGAVGGGALALLGSLVMQALRNAGAPQAEEMAIDPRSKLAAGLRDPENQQEEAQVEALAELTIRAMINAAKIDGRIDDSELERIVGKVSDGGISPAEREFLMQELRKPIDTDAIVSQVRDQQTAAQIYVASLLAIDLDTDVERAYMRDLATKLRLDTNLVRHLQQTVGVH